MTDRASTIRATIQTLPVIGMCYWCTGELYEGVLHAHCEDKYISGKVRDAEFREAVRALRENRSNHG